MDALLEPVVTAARTWADERQLPLDVDLLVSLLDLRLARDQFGDAVWPAGSARHLMTVRLAQHGPVEAPDPQAVADVLEVWWRFLRTTGRMSASSAPVRELVAEARKARRAMAKACAAPEAVRRRQAHAAHRERLDALGEPSAADVSAAAFRDSGLWHDLDLLLARVAAGIDLVDGELPLPVARELFDELQLGSWLADAEEVAALVAGGQDEVEPVEPLAWDEAWASSSQVVPLDRAWWTAVRSGLVEADGERARVVAEVPADDEAWRRRGVDCLLALAEWFAWEFPVDALVMVLVLLDDPLAPVRTVDELVEHWLSEVAAMLAEHGGTAEREDLVEAADQVVAAIALFDDAGLWLREGPVLRGTPFGHDVAASLVATLATGFPGVDRG